MGEMGRSQKERMRENSGGRNGLAHYFVGAGVKSTSLLGAATNAVEDRSVDPIRLDLAYITSGVDRTALDGGQT